MKPCDVCKKRVAIVHISEVLPDGTVKTVSLCDQCAKAQGVGGGKGKSVPQQLVELMAQVVDKQLEEMPEDVRNKRCPACGITYKEFRQKGQFGCAKDYEAFEEAVAGLLERLHYGGEHRGRAPRQDRERSRRQTRLLEMKKALTKAVEEEDYETAARLRDEIRELEAEEDEGSTDPTS